MYTVLNYTLDSLILKFVTLSLQASSITRKRVYYQQALSFKNLIGILDCEEGVLKKMSREIMIHNLQRIKTISEAIKKKFKPASNQATEKTRGSVLDCASKETMQMDKPIVVKSKKIRKSRKQKDIMDSIVPQQTYKHIGESSNTLQISASTTMEKTRGKALNCPTKETMQMNENIGESSNTQQNSTQSAQHIILATNPASASATMAETRGNVLDYPLMEHKETVQMDKPIVNKSNKIQESQKQKGIMDSMVPQHILIAKCSTTMEEMRGKALDCPTNETMQMHNHIGESSNSRKFSTQSAQHVFLVNNPASASTTMAETKGNVLDHPLMEHKETVQMDKPIIRESRKQKGITDTMVPQQISMAKCSSTTIENMKGKALDYPIKEKMQMYKHIGENSNTLQITTIMAETRGNVLDYLPMETTNTPRFSHPEPILQHKDSKITNELPPISETILDVSMEMFDVSMEFGAPTSYVVPNEQEEPDLEKLNKILSTNQTKESLRSSLVMEGSDPVQVPDDTVQDPDQGILPVQRLVEAVCVFEWLN